MNNSRDARRSLAMAAPNGLTKRRLMISENMHTEVVTVRDVPENKERDPESLNRSKRRRSGRFPPRNERYVEEDSSGEILRMRDHDVEHNHHSMSSPSDRNPRHAASLKVADEMIGVPVPRKARSACIKRSHDCRTSTGSSDGGFGEASRRHPTSPGSYSVEVVSPSSLTVSGVSGSKPRIPKLPKFSGTTENDLEIEIAEVLSGLKKQPQNTRREDVSENSLKSSEVNGLEIGGLISCKARTETVHSPEISLNLVPETHRIKGIKTSSVVSDTQTRQETPSILGRVQEKPCLDPVVSRWVSERPQMENNGDGSDYNSKLDIDLMVPTTLPSPARVSVLPLVSDSFVTNNYCKGDISVKSIKKIIPKSEMPPDEVKQKKVKKHEWLNLDLERLREETDRDSSRRLQNLDCSQTQQAKSVQISSVLPLPVAVSSWSSRLPPQIYVPLIQNGKPVDGSNGSSTLVQPRPKRCATHFFIARNILLHQHFVKTNTLSQRNPSVQGSSPILSLNSHAEDRIAVNSSVPKEKPSESGHFASSRRKKPQPPPPDSSSSIVPAPAFIFPTNHHLQPVMVPSKSPHPTNSPCVAVGSASVNFNHPSSSASKATSQYLTIFPNTAYSFQLPSSIRGGTPGQALSFYSPQVFQHPQLLQKQSQAQRETKAVRCSSSSHKQLQPQGSVNSLPSQVNVQNHCQQSAGDHSDSRDSHTQEGGPYGQIITAHVQPPNFSMSFASFASGATTAPANLNFSSNGFHILSAPPAVHQKSHQVSDSKTGAGSCLSNAEDLKKTFPGKLPATMMNGQTLVFDNPSRTLNFVSGTWPLPAATTVSGDPSMFAHHLTQRQQQSGQSKTTTHSQADSVFASPSQWKNHVTSSLTSCSSLNQKQFQSHQQIRTHGQTQISFSAPSKSQTSQGRSGGGSISVTGSTLHGKAANSKVSNSKTLPLPPTLSSASHAQDRTENSAFGSTQKTSPVCGRNVPPIITSCPGHLSELKY